MTRLEILNPDLADKLRKASANKQRAVGLAACEFAVSQSMVDEPVVREALEVLRHSRQVTEAKTKQVEGLVARLEGEYFDLQEAAEEGRSTPAEYLRVFSQSRAVSALLSALKEDSFEAATEAVYEAAAVTDDQAKLFTHVEAILR